jgi:hypothetical protein
MFSLGNLRKEAPLRWAAVVAIRLFLILCVIEFLSILLSAIPYCMRARRTTALSVTAQLGEAVGMYLDLTGRMPATLDALKVPQPGNDGDPVMDFGSDPWGHSYCFTLDGPRSATITCLGADGELGGEGDDADIVARWPPPNEATPR